MSVIVTTPWRHCDDTMMTLWRHHENMFCKPMCHHNVVTVSSQCCHSVITVSSRLHSWNLLLGYTNFNTNIDTEKRKFNSDSRYLKILNLNQKVRRAIMTFDFTFFPKFFKILNLNQLVGTAMMTCLTSLFSLIYLKDRMVIMTCPTSLLFPKLLKILNLNQNFGMTIMTATSPFSLVFENFE